MSSKTQFLPSFLEDGFVCNFRSESWQIEYELDHQAQAEDINYVNKRQRSYFGQKVTHTRCVDTPNPVCCFTKLRTLCIRFLASFLKLPVEKLKAVSLRSTALDNAVCPSSSKMPATR